MSLLKSKRDAVSLILIVIAGSLAYFNTFNVPFYFDDEINIVQNPIVRDFHYFTEPSNAVNVLADAKLSLFKTRFFGYFTFALNYRLNGLEVKGYHAVNLAVHIAAAVILYWLITLTFKTPYFQNSSESGNTKKCPDNILLIPLFSALLFVTHPLQTETVTYIVQRFTSLAAMFYLASLAFYIKSRLAEGIRRSLIFYLLLLISAVLAMKTKEISLTLPFSILVYEVMFFKGDLKKRLLFLLPVLLTLLIIPLAFIDITRPFESFNDAVSRLTRDMTTTDFPAPVLSPSDYFFTQLRVIVTYIRLLFFPVNQNLDYDYPVFHSFFNIEIILSFLFLSAIFFIACYLYHISRSAVYYFRLISFGIFFFFITLSVESGFIPITDVIYEHRIYLPSAGFFIAAAVSAVILADKLKINKETAKKLLIAFIALIALTFTGASYSRNIVWQDNVKFWEDVVRKSPGKARGYNNLGDILYRKGEVEKSLGYFVRAAEISPNYFKAHTNAGIVHLKRGDHIRAVESLTKSILLNPNFTGSYYNRGVAYFNMREYKKALEDYNMAIVIAPDYEHVRAYRGLVYFRLHEFVKAVEDFKAACDSGDALGCELLKEMNRNEFKGKK